LKRNLVRLIAPMLAKCHVLFRGFDQTHLTRHKVSTVKDETGIRKKLDYASQRYHHGDRCGRGDQKRQIYAREGRSEQHLPCAPIGDGDHAQHQAFALVYDAAGVPVAAGVLYPFFGLLNFPMFAVAVMSLSSVSVIGNALRLRRVQI